MVVWIPPLIISPIKHDFKKITIKHGEHGSLMIKHRDLIDINSGIDGDVSCGLDGNIQNLPVFIYTLYLDVIENG